VVAKLAELAVRSSSETVVSSSTRFAQVTVPSPITTYARRGGVGQPSGEAIKFRQTIKAAPGVADLDRRFAHDASS